jgi:MFS superfamily sulfate permease-like transporter
LNPGSLKGVLLAAIVPMLLLIRRVAQPHVARLGRVAGTNRYSDIAQSRQRIGARRARPARRGGVALLQHAATCAT